jgi:hypothetical protein
MLSSPRRVGIKTKTELVFTASLISSKKILLSRHTCKWKLGIGLVQLTIFLNTNEIILGPYHCPGYNPKAVFAS